MKISEALDLLNKQMAFSRTVKGRPINDEAMAFVQATIDDEKNYSSEVVFCPNCGIILSNLLVPKGCPNCNYKFVP